MLILGYIKPEIFDTFLDWGYSERLKITKENALDLLFASEYLLAPTLVVSCAKFLVLDVLGKENACEIINVLPQCRAHFANEIECDRLIVICAKFIVSDVLARENALQIFNLFRRIKVHFANETEYEHLIATIKKYIKV